MSAEAIGALVLLEDYYFYHRGIPKTDAECAQVCKLGARKFARIRAQLFASFDDEGRSADLDASIEETERIIASKRDAGRKGGEAKALAYARQLPQQNPTQPQPQPQPQSELQKDEHLESSSAPPAPPPSEPRARQGDEIAAEVLAKLPASARAHPVWRGLSAWMAQLLADGVERVDIVVGFAGCLHTLRNRPPNSLAYFSAAIERARIARTAPLPEVAAKADQPHLLGRAGDILKKRIGADVFDSWFGKATLINVSGGTVTIGIETAFMRSRIIANYQTACTEAFQAVSPIPIVRLVVVVGGAPIGAGSP